MIFTEVKLSVDRIDCGIAVCYSDDDKKYKLPADGLTAGLIISAVFDGDGRLISFTPLIEETDEVRATLAERTKALFKRGKK